MPSSGDGGSFDAMFTIVAAFITVTFVVVIGLMIHRIVQGGRQWNANNHAPVLSQRMTVVAKRADVQHSSASDLRDARTSGASATTYFVTMEDTATRERHEFRVNVREYGTLADGDLGMLTHQGTRCRGFVRERWRGRGRAFGAPRRPGKLNATTFEPSSAASPRKNRCASRTVRAPQ